MFFYIDVYQGTLLCFSYINEVNGVTCVTGFDNTLFVCCCFYFFSKDGSLDYLCWV